MAIKPTVVPLTGEEVYTYFCSMNEINSSSYSGSVTDLDVVVSLCITTFYCQSQALT